MAIQDDLNQNIQLLNQTMAALNANMFGSTGGRPGQLGGANQGRPGQGINSLGDPHKDTIKLAASNTLLEKRLKETNDTIKYLVQNQKDFGKNLNQYTQTASKYFDNALQKFSAKQLDKEVPEKLTALLSDSINKGLVDPLKNFEDVIRLNKRVQTDNIETALRYNDELSKLGEQTVLNESAFSDLHDKIEETGWSTDDLKAALNACGGDTQKLKESMAKVSATMAIAAAADERQAAASDQATKALKLLGSALLAGAGLYVRSARAAAQYGTTFEDITSTLKHATMAGLDPEELAKIQHEQAQAIYSSNTSIEQFQQNISDAAWQLYQFTGSLTDGAKLTAGFLGTFRTLSADQSQYNSFQKDQIEQFGRMHKVFSVTTEEFQNLNQTLLSSHSVQTAMYKLNQNQRVAAFQDLQATYARLRSEGLLDDQAKKVTETLAGLTGAKAQTRIEQSAKLQAVAGALGFGKEGAEAAAIIQSGQGRTPEGSKRLTEILTKLQRATSNRVAGAYGKGTTAGLGTELQVDALTGIIGDILGPEAATAALATSKGRQQTGAAEAARAASPEQHETLLQISAIQETLSTGVGDIIKTISKGVLDIIGALAFLKVLAGGGGSVLGSGAGALGAGGGLLGAAKIAGGFAAAATAGYEFGQMLDGLTESATGMSASERVSRWSWLGGNTSAADQASADNTSFFNTSAEHFNKIGKEDLIKQIQSHEGGLGTSEEDMKKRQEDEDLIKTLNALTKAFTSDDAPILRKLQKLTVHVQQGNEQAAAQADDQLNASNNNTKVRQNTYVPPQQG